MYWRRVFAFVPPVGVRGRHAKGLPTKSYSAWCSQVFKNPADGKWLLIGQPFELGGRDHKVSSHAHYRVRAPPPSPVALPLAVFSE
jgi:hypothetical protein